MSDIKFYEKVSKIISDSTEYQDLRVRLKELTVDTDGTIYVIENPLYSLTKDSGDEQFEDSIGAFAILIPDTKIIFTHLNATNDADFDDYIGTFLDSITALSELFEFKKKIGNSRKWHHLFIEEPLMSDVTHSLIKSIRLEHNDKLILKILVSLVTGSINTPDKGGEADNLLDAVKKRIVQFDGDQTRFIYDDLRKKKISIQGLAGTGKTELLFHRLVNLYTQTDKSIVFTCHSKVLANDIRKRLPVFFDRMKISDRSEIDNRVKVMSSWGSLYQPNSGFYRYICEEYNLDFINYRDSGVQGFDGVCKIAIEQLRKLQDLGEFKPCFGYVLVDEAQDFSDSFFELCQMVTSDQVIIASDIFQTIFSSQSQLIQQPDFTLNKVYRTDPKNFMFSQFLGFGIKDNPMIKWLDDDSWRASGYTFSKENITNSIYYRFSREPINRFNDVDNSSIVPTELFLETDNTEILNRVKNILLDIKSKFPNVEAGDIGIVFLSHKNTGYELANMISSMIIEDFDWETQKIYEGPNRVRRKNKVFISNQNNIKGLEFSFLIGIVLDKITDNVEIRNTVYMMMTRSFLTSFLILGSSNSQVYFTYKPLLDEILETGEVRVKEPSPDEVIKEEVLKVMVEGTLTFEQKVEQVLKDNELYDSSNVLKLKNLVSTLVGDTGVSVQEITEIVNNNIGFFK
mgnify:CR=1 FL=1